MNNICEIKIKGLDPNRMPNLKYYRPNFGYKKCIHIFFELTQKAPSSWFSDFNSLNSSHNENAKIDQNDGVYIKTWVRDIQDIPKELERIKQIIEQCNSNYIKRKQLEDQALQSSEMNQTDSLNDELEKVLASLSYD